MDSVISLCKGCYNMAELVRALKRSFLIGSLSGPNFLLQIVTIVGHVGSGS